MCDGCQLGSVQENADRAAQQLPPMEFKDMERLAKSVLEDNNLPTQVGLSLYSV